MSVTTASTSEQSPPSPFFSLGHYEARLRLLLDVGLFRDDIIPGKRREQLSYCEPLIMCPVYNLSGL